MKRAALLLIAAACKKDEPERLSVSWRDGVCGCADLACVKQVSDDLAKRGDVRANYHENQFDRQMITWGEACISKLVSPVVAKPPHPPVPPVPADPVADALIATTRQWHANPRLVFSRIEARYVDARGRLDDDHGVLRMTFAASSQPIVDDSKRKIGAPVPPDTTLPAECPNIVFEKTAWSVGYNGCGERPAHAPRCTVTEIWRRAIEAKAPPEALAILTYTTDTGPSWTFQISDVPRKIAVFHTFPDDCNVELEKP